MGHPDDGGCTATPICWLIAPHVWRAQPTLGYHLGAELWAQAGAGLVLVVGVPGAIDGLNGDEIVAFMDGAPDAAPAARLCEMAVALHRVAGPAGTVVFARERPYDLANALAAALAAYEGMRRDECAALIRHADLRAEWQDWADLHAEGW